jgi:prepilin-type N-terminal cleavage/methylation domain-containing protein
VARTPRRAFTLLEMILVLAVIAFLIAVALPSVQAMLSDVKLQAAADHFRARLAEARSRAILESRPYRIAAMPGDSSYRIAPDSPEFWGEGQAAADESNGVEPLIVEDKLPENIPFQLSEGRGGDSGPWVHLLSFQIDGSCDRDYSLRLEFEDCLPLEINVRGLTGSVTVRRIDTGGTP